MTPAELSEWEAKCRAAEGGDWKTSSINPDVVVTFHVNGGRKAVAQCRKGVDPEQAYAAAAFIAASSPERVLELIQEVRRFREALDKIRDPRKRHREPDAYTELGCVMNIADEALADSKEVGGEG